MKTQTKRGRPIALALLLIPAMPLFIAAGCGSGGGGGSNPLVEIPDGHFQGIPVYGDMSAVSLTNLQTWYNARNGTEQDKFKAGITRIDIIGGSDATVSGNTLNLGATAIGPTIGTALGPIVAQLQPSKGVYLAYQQKTESYEQWVISHGGTEARRTQRGITTSLCLRDSV
ncbi:MAG: hypothetical protein FWG29_11710 [Treponema sp.]|nr:hypothetical protein [Treponema sp.]